MPYKNKNSARAQDLPLSPKYYQRLNPDALLATVSEYLALAPHQPDCRLAASTDLPNPSAAMPGAGQRSDCLEVALHRCLDVVSEFITVSHVAPGLLPGLYTLARLYYLVGEATSALDACKACLELDANFIEAHLLMAEVGIFKCQTTFGKVKMRYVIK
ncbi:unnamed protein product [Protopolystoma xenopodis]|uniref:Tetratricopeptide repeat protein 21A/21B second ARM domain-containing protein n=1 Tax=Protopolystoma xenopodis TaxID=117903 RepID=A0A3S5FC46_9PLAT|nr:unnamed protein product [Protopolystoma xenopodis]